MINCPECGKQVSSRASACPNCGFPIQDAINKETLTAAENIQNHMVQCKKCGTWNDVGSTYCKSCNKIITGEDYKHSQKVANSSSLSNHVVNVRTNKKTTRYTNKKQGMGIFSKVLIGLCFLSIIGSVFGDTDPVESVVTDTTAVATQESANPKDSFISVLIGNENVTSEAADKAYEILSAHMGFDEIVAEPNLGALTVFDIKADSFNLLLTVNDSVYRITCGNYTLYENNTIKYTKQDLMDRSLNGNEVYYYSIAQEIVSSNLKSPKSADFPSIAMSPSDVEIARNKELVAVQSYVDAENSLGTLVRSKYLVEFKIIDLKSFEYEIVYLNIDGNEYGEYLDIE